MKTAENFASQHFGFAGVEPLVGDFDGDGRDDFACYYPVTGGWYFMKSTEGFATRQFGFAGTVPVAGYPTNR
ncbi:MAG: hypothetical protein JXR37_01105 [Kiritimatiellae bacterium]|nr:hypothetical protein [Kiritimatiellia bacterium]